MKLRLLFSVCAFSLFVPSAALGQTVTPPTTEQTFSVDIVDAKTFRKAADGVVKGVEKTAKSKCRAIGRRLKPSFKAFTSSVGINTNGKFNANANVTIECK